MKRTYLCKSEPYFRTDGKTCNCKKGRELELKYKLQELDRQDRLQHPGETENEREERKRREELVHKERIRESERQARKAKKEEIINPLRVILALIFVAIGIAIFIYGHSLDYLITILVAE